MQQFDELALRMVAARLRLGTPANLPDDVCWPWIGQRSSHGYGLIQFTSGGRRHTVTASRVVCWVRGELPLTGRAHQGLHDCDNPPCCNPAHIKPGTPKSNIADAVAKGHMSTPRRFAGRFRKLTDDNVRAIRSQQRPLIDIASDFGVTVCYVAKIRMRTSKAHVRD